MAKISFKAQAFFGEVALRAFVEGEEAPQTLMLSPEQAKSLAKALTRAARAAEKTEG
jgi:hypothetical protein